MATLDDFDEAKTVRDHTLTVGYAVKESLSLKLVLLGLAFVVTGYVLQTGVYAALLPIWGAGLVIVGVVSYVAIWRTRR